MRQVETNGEMHMSFNLDYSNLTRRLVTVVCHGGQRLEGALGYAWPNA